MNLCLQCESLYQVESQWFLIFNCFHYVLILYENVLMNRYNYGHSQYFRTSMEPEQIDSTLMSLWRTVLKRWTRVAVADAIFKKKTFDIAPRWFRCIHEAFHYKTCWSLSNSRTQLLNNSRSSGAVSNYFCSLNFVYFYPVIHITPPPVFVVSDVCFVITRVGLSVDNQWR